MVFHAQPSAASGSAWIPLLYDTVVLILTLYRTLPSLRWRETQAGDIVRVILRDGILYYRLGFVTCDRSPRILIACYTIDSLICGVTLALTVMIKAAPPGIQNIAAQYVYPHYQHDYFLTRLSQTGTFVRTVVNVVLRS